MRPLSCCNLCICGMPEPEHQDKKDKSESRQDERRPEDQPSLHVFQGPSV